MEIKLYGNVKPLHTETDCCHAIIDVVPADVRISDGRAFYTCPVCSCEVQLLPEEIQKAGWGLLKRFALSGVLDV